MVPTPNSYSRLICSKSSTLFLLVIGGLHDSGLLSQRGESSRDEVGQIRAPKWPESECQNQIKRIDDRLRNGSFDPDADLRDLDEYLRSCIGRSSQDLIANRERLVKMDNQLELWQREMMLKVQKKSWAEGKQITTEKLLDTENRKLDAQKCSSCIASLKDELANYEILIGQLEVEILDLRCQIENRVKQYNIQLQERVKFGEQVQSLNDGWSRFNNSLDELQKALSKVN